MSTIKGLAFAIAGTASMSRWRQEHHPALTTVLYHGFFFDGESKQRARDRLRRQLDWLRRSYSPLTLAQCHQALAAGTFPPKALLITADDAKIDLLEVHDEFTSFGVPLSVFVCAGWTAQASAIEPDGLLARVVAALEWYSGPDTILPIGPAARKIAIGRTSASATIDQILSEQAYFLPWLNDVLVPLEKAAAKSVNRTICNWSELVSMRDLGIQFGSHSVSHINLARASNIRLQFEVDEAKRLIARKVSRCTSFAYPFGIEGTWSSRTTDVLRSAGMTAAFLTHPGFATPDTPNLCLPRFALPERAMSDSEFRGRVRGAGVLLGALRRTFKRASTPVIAR